MEFKCPKCEFVLTGTPDECPLCHEPLVYSIRSRNANSEVVNNMAAFGAMPHGAGAPAGGAPMMDMRPDASRAPGAGASDPDRDPRPITGFNIVSFIYILLCMLFFAFVLLYPMFNTPDGIELAFWGSAAFPRASETTSNALFPFLPGYSYLDYILFVGKVAIPAFIEINGGFDFRFVLPFILNAIPILLMTIAILILIPGFIITLVNMIKRKLPKYIEKSRVDRFGDPCNVMGLIIASSIFYFIAIFVPVLISKLPFSLPFVLDDVLGRSPLMMSFLMLGALFGIVIIAAIVKAVFRSKVNPKP